MLSQRWRSSRVGRMFALIIARVWTCLPVCVDAWLLLLSARFIHPDTDTFLFFVFSGCDQHFLGSWHCPSLTSPLSLPAHSFSSSAGNTLETWPRQHCWWAASLQDRQVSKRRSGCFVDPSPRWNASNATRVPLLSQFALLFRHTGPNVSFLRRNVQSAVWVQGWWCEKPARVIHENFVYGESQRIIKWINYTEQNM